MSKPLVTLPSDFVATKYPGYFWNLRTRTLFSIKVTGVLRQMVFTKPSFWNDWKSGYRVCVNGRRRWLTSEYLNSLTPVASVVPVMLPQPNQEQLPF